MNKILTILLIASPIYIHAQIEIKNTSIYDTDQKVIYRSINNILRVTGVDDRSDIRLVSATAGEIRRINASTGYYDFAIETKGHKYDTLTVLDGDKILAVDTFEIRALSVPIIKLGSIKDTAGVVSEILDDPNLHVVFPNCSYISKMRVVSFDLSIYRSDIMIYPFDTASKQASNGYPGAIPGHTEGNALKNEQIACIKMLKPGDLLYFGEIKVTCPECTVRQLCPIKIRIVDQSGRE